jgi:uncharacterized protein (DUF305 family)
MNRKRSLVLRTGAVAAAAVAAVVLAACGGGSDTAGPSGDGAGSPAASAAASQGRHNEADVAFAKGMIPHHRQAIEMAGLVAGRAASAEVKKLAEDIEEAQDPEIETLSGWLASWGEEVPAEGAMGHSTHDMGGMMSQEEMRELRESSGTAFDTAFLEMMIKHHEGAVEMARTEQSDGSHEAARKMADSIVTSQTAEITQMHELLGKS